MLMVYLVGAIAGSVGHLAYCTFLVPWLEVQVPCKKKYMWFVNEHTPIANNVSDSFVLHQGAPYDDFNYSMTPYVLVSHCELDISFWYFKKSDFIAVFLLNSLLSLLIVLSGF